LLRTSASVRCGKNEICAPKTLGLVLAVLATNVFRRMHRETENYLEGEKKEMVDLYETKGLTREDAQIVVDILAKNKETFVDRARAT
jgi:hypothetical protein